MAGFGSLAACHVWACKLSMGRLPMAHLSPGPLSGQCLLRSFYLLPSGDRMGTGWLVVTVIFSFGNYDTHAFDLF